MMEDESLQLSFDSIQAATNCFSQDNKIGEGEFGDVYQGLLPNGTQIAVKRLSKCSRQGAQEFKNEIVLIAKLQHRNLVRLLGFCSDGQEMILIYEFIPNKSLDHYLSDSANQTLLNWPKRLMIIHGIARGLLYLHEDSPLKIIHRDLKASNVLLDRDMNPKITDFGTARIVGADISHINTKRVVGTYGYMPPEYVMHGHYSVKSDVYSFGVLVLEIITGKKNESFRQSDHMPDILSYLSMAEISGYKDYVAGLLAGVATVAIGHPFDTVKVKMQKHNNESHGIKYKNALHCTARVLQSEGMKGLYRGATSSFVGVAFESSLLFGIYSQTKHKLQLMRGELHSEKPRLQAIVPSASLGGAIISFVLCPSELVKCRIQVQGADSLVPKSSRYSGPLDCAFKTIKDEGVKGIFRGGLSTFFRESIGNAAFFIAYENVRYHMHSQLKLTSVEHNNVVDVGIGILSGGLGGVAFWSAVLPFDVAKTIIQTSADKDSTRNPFQILNTIYKRAGIRGCYTGLGPTILRAFPANAAAIVTWELAVKLLGIKRD